MNFIEEICGISTNNKQPLVLLDEMTVKNLWNYLQHGFVLIGIRESNCMQKELIKKLQADIVKNDFRYCPIFGCCVNGNGGVSYLSAFVVANLNKAKEPCDFTALRLFADEISVKYRQVSICENSSCTSIISLIDAFFEDWLKGNGLSCLYKGCYLNPSPMSYSERYIRDMKKNEIFINI
ncbi:hypothetical protein [Phocaeicola dorei]|jgi:hypothetical protein|uniref:Uncharacterized protein n=1 Tax=Phocaeicola dorei TaxID=357276 RepID=A0A5M5ZQ41_9BACT|nr:hypothetical protein [Phocaeicola dorei]KAA5379209.1 hypothetical protein F2Y61_21680 [Phocaeicola dorei]